MSEPIRDPSPGERFCETCEEAASCSVRTWWRFGYPQDCKPQEYRAWLEEQAAGRRRQ